LLKVAERLERYDRLAFASTCTSCRDAIWEVVNREWEEDEEKQERKRFLAKFFPRDKEEKKFVTNLGGAKLIKAPCFSLGWFKWIRRSFERREKKVNRIYDREKGEVYDTDLIMLAAFQGSFELLTFLRTFTSAWKHTAQKEFYEEASAGAAAGGHMEVLEWLKSEYKRPITSAAIHRAAEGGHLEIVKWLRAQDPPCPWDKWVCKEAARGGHLVVLQWMRAQDPPCPWDEETSNAAAERGDLEVLQWIRSQDPPCPWNSHGGTCEVAAEGGHLAMLQWMRSQYPPCPWHKEWCRQAAAMKGRTNVVKWIQEVDDESDAELPEL